MTIRNLEALFHPKSIAVIGASSRPGSLGAVILDNLIGGGFAGEIYPVNPKHKTLHDLSVHANLARLPSVPSLALICTPRRTWTDLIARLGQLGTHAAVILSVEAACDTSLTEALQAAARPTLLRLLGPNSLGFMTPALGLNASMAHLAALPGHVALVSQSNALCSSVLGWADARGIGFSRVIALGNQLDIDCGDVLDFLASDPLTSAIVVSVATVRAARKFMSAARAAARNKPVYILRSGRATAEDAVYDAAFRRAGIVRVDSVEDLLDAVETLEIGRFSGSDAVTLIGNGAEIGSLAVDALHAAGGRLAPLSEASRQALALALPGRTITNPLDLGDDASADRYAAVLQALAPQRDSGALFIVHAPSAAASAGAVADALVAFLPRWPRALLTCWLGAQEASVREVLHAHGIAAYPTPERIARAFMRMLEYRHNQVLLAQTPGTAPADFGLDRESARAIVGAAQAAGRRELDANEAHELLACFHVALEQEANQDPYLTRRLHVSLSVDAIFGPILTLQGLRVESAALGLPPLNSVLARAVIERCATAQSLPEIVRIALERLLTRVSHLVCDLPAVAALTLVLAADEREARVCAARIEIAEEHPDTAAHPYARLAILPYPSEFEERVEWGGTALTIRPIRPEDEAAHGALVHAMSAEDLRMRFFGATRPPDHTQLARWTQIDYDREMAFIACSEDESGQLLTHGVVRAIADPDNDVAEFAIAIRSAETGRHLGALLMSKIVRYCRAHGTRTLVGEVLRENTRMLALAREIGFTQHTTQDPSVIGIRLALNGAVAA